MTKKLEFPERRPEALFEHSQDRLVEAVKEWVDHAGGVDPQDLLRELDKTVIEQVLETELDHHLGYPKHDSSGDGSGNTRNGTRPKTVETIVGDVKIDVPRTGTGHSNRSRFALISVACRVLMTWSSRCMEKD